MLNCLTDPNNRADFDANRKTPEDLVSQTVMSKLVDKLLKKDGSHEIPGRGRETLNSSAPELISCPWRSQKCRYGASICPAKDLDLVRCNVGCTSQGKAGALAGPWQLESLG